MRQITCTGGRNVLTFLRPWAGQKKGFEGAVYAQVIVSPLAVAVAFDALAGGGGNRRMVSSRGTHPKSGSGADDTRQHPPGAGRRCRNRQARQTDCGTSPRRLRAARERQSPKAFHV